MWSAVVVQGRLPLVWLARKKGLGRRRLVLEGLGGRRLVLEGLGRRRLVLEGLGGRRLVSWLPMGEGVSWGRLGVARVVWLLPGATRGRGLGVGRILEREAMCR